VFAFDLRRDQGADQVVARLAGALFDQSPEVRGHRSLRRGPLPAHTCDRVGPGLELVGCSIGTPRSSAMTTTGSK
jgi:hypothetical protein